MHQKDKKPVNKYFVEFELMIKKSSCKFQVGKCKLTVLKKFLEKKDTTKPNKIIFIMSKNTIPELDFTQ